MSPDPRTTVAWAGVARTAARTSAESTSRRSSSIGAPLVQSEQYEHGDRHRDAEEHAGRHRAGAQRLVEHVAHPAGAYPIARAPNGAGAGIPGTTAKNRSEELRRQLGQPPLEEPALGVVVCELERGAQRVASLLGATQAPQQLAARRVQVVVVAELEVLDDRQPGLRPGGLGHGDGATELDDRRAGHPRELAVERG